MPRSKPTPDEIERGVALAVDAVTTLLNHLRNAQGELVEAARLVGLSWPEIAELTGKSSGAAARGAHDRWKSGR